jgi:hypothetical protein
MPRVCIVEAQVHPAAGVLGRSLPKLEEFRVETVAEVPADLIGVDVLVLNNIPSTPDSIPAQRILDYINSGGGMFAIHDTVFPYCRASECPSAHA